jgi:capsular polysaccharide biosynthesis protein
MNINTANAPTFSLMYIIQLAKVWYKHILIFAIIVAIATAVYAFFLKNKYMSYGNFYPSTSLTTARDNLFRDVHQDAIYIFGSESEVDQMYAIGNNSALMSNLIKQFKLAEHYEIDVKNDTRGYEKLFKKFDKNYQVTKGNYGNLEITVSDHDKQLASDIANEAIIAIQDQFRSYYVKHSEGAAATLRKQMAMQDSTINNLTDTLVKLREQYGIYELISPSRKGEVRTQSRNARGIEVIQIIEELKDKYVMDRAKYESIHNEFTAAKHKDMPYVHVIQYPEPSGRKVSPFRTIMVLSSFAIACVLGLLIVIATQSLSNLQQQLAKAS